MNQLLPGSHPGGSADAGRTEVVGSESWSAWQQERLRGLEAAFAGPLQRAALLDTLSSTVRDSIAGGTSAAVLLFDINKFAEINSAWGLSLGDELLAAAAGRIGASVHDWPSASVGARPILGRLDGDHFAVIVPEVASLERLRTAAAAIVRELAQPFTLAGHSIAASARVAIVQIPVHGRSATAVLSRGFRLLNGAARSKPDGVAVSQEEAIDGPSTALLERDLMNALTRDELFLALQPKVGTADGAVKGAEALVRWQHPELGFLPPPLFIAVAEKSGLIIDLGLRILRDACRASATLAAGGRALSVAVNVSPHQLAHPHFLSGFLEVLDAEGVSPQTLEIEVTETAAMMGGAPVLERLQALRRCGIPVVIDDFGTGFSNLASLAALPADTLKIDRSLVVGGEHGGRSAALLGIAGQLGRTFGMATVAEGVETASQMRNVTELGFDMVQGYFTGRPVRAAEFTACYLPP